MGAGRRRGTILYSGRELTGFPLVRKQRTYRKVLAELSGLQFYIGGVFPPLPGTSAQ